MKKLKNTLKKYEKATQKKDLNALGSKIQTTVRALQKGGAVLKAKNSLLQKILIKYDNKDGLTYRDRQHMRDLKVEKTENTAYIEQINLLIQLGRQGKGSKQDLQRRSILRKEQAPYFIERALEHMEACIKEFIKVKKYYKVFESDLDCMGVFLVFVEPLLDLKEHKLFLQREFEKFTHDIKVFTESNSEFYETKKDRITRQNDLIYNEISDEQRQKYGKKIQNMALLTAKKDAFFVREQSELKKIEDFALKKYNNYLYSLENQFIFEKQLSKFIDKEIVKKVQDKVKKQKVRKQKVKPEEWRNRVERFFDESSIQRTDESLQESSQYYTPFLSESLFPKVRPVLRDKGHEIQNF
ncbi:hypothetical protein [Holospora curviuscula]|nr:hypothetical protein [Holospora curviuscula]